MDFESLQRMFDNWARAWSFPGAGEDAANPAREDPRFQDPAWAQSPYGQFLVNWYGTANRSADHIARLGDGLPDHQRQVWNFYVRFALDAVSPSNFFLTNPQAWQKAVDTGGQSVLTGMTRLLQDLQNNTLPASSDREAFTVGGNLASTKGSVVFENPVFQLIQYRPLVPTVLATPLLIVPPCVNKFYAFDLNEKKSFVAYLLSQEHNVFIVSWRNPHPGSSKQGWEDYVFDGVHQAIESTCEISGSAKTNLLSWCIGGALSASALAVMTPAERKRVASATFLTTLIDYSSKGDLGIFVDELQVNALKPRLQMRGVMPGQDLAKAMAMLHAKDSIWNFYVNNYLLGDNIPPFDVLYWNSDTANVPAELYQYYIENMYLKNLLREPGALSLRGRKVDLANIDMPTCFVSATEDHIVPWQGTLLALGLVDGPASFILTTGGHVSGTTINHPAKSRKKYWVDGPRTTDADEWKAGATLHEGSWWPEWCQWAKQYGGKTVAAPKALGSRDFPPLEDAPGSYVLEEVPQG